MENRAKTELLWEKCRNQVVRTWENFILSFNTFEMRFHPDSERVSEAVYKTRFSTKNIYLLYVFWLCIYTKPAFWGPKNAHFWKRVKFFGKIYCYCLCVSYKTMNFLTVTSCVCVLHYRKPHLREISSLSCHLVRCSFSWWRICHNLSQQHFSTYENENITK